MVFRDVDLRTRSRLRPVRPLQVPSRLTRTPLRHHDHIYAARVGRKELSCVVRARTRNLYSFVAFRSLTGFRLYGNRSSGMEELPPEDFDTLAEHYGRRSANGDLAVAKDASGRDFLSLTSLDNFCNMGRSTKRYTATPTITARSPASKQKIIKVTGVAMSSVPDSPQSRPNADN